MIERYRRNTVLWLFENVQASFEEIAEVLNTSREEVSRLYQEAKSERDRIFHSPAPFGPQIYPDPRDPFWHRS